MILEVSVRLVLAVALSGCASSGGERPGNGTCVAGSQIACACADGRDGVQACNVDGVSFTECDCDGGTPTATHGSEPDGSSGAAGSSTTDDDPGTCGGADCTVDPPTGDTGAPLCDRLAGMVDGSTSVWMDGAATGYDAGSQLCQAMGADHACTYTDLVGAEANGELASLSVGSTVWIHRLAPVWIDDIFYPAELGGRCVNWSYDANELADGEFLEITSEGPVFNLDTDTFYDGLDPSHADPLTLPCGGVTRMIACCLPDC